MEYQDIVRRSITAFMEGTMPQETAALKEGGLTYTPEYFDDLEASVITAPKGKKAKKEDENESDV